MHTKIRIEGAGNAIETRFENSSRLQGVKEGLEISMELMRKRKRVIV